MTHMTSILKTGQVLHKIGAFYLYRPTSPNPETCFNMFWSTIYRGLRFVFFRVSWLWHRAGICWNCDSQVRLDYHCDAQHHIIVRGHRKRIKSLVLSTWSNVHLLNLDISIPVFWLPLGISTSRSVLNCTLKTQNPEDNTTEVEFQEETSFLGFRHRFPSPVQILHPCDHST